MYLVIIPGSDPGERGSIPLGTIVWRAKTNATNVEGNAFKRWLDGTGTCERSIHAPFAVSHIRYVLNCITSENGIFVHQNISDSSTFHERKCWRKLSNAFSSVRIVYGSIHAKRFYGGLNRQLKSGMEIANNTERNWSDRRCGVLMDLISQTIHGWLKLPNVIFAHSFVLSIRTRCGTQG